MSRVLIVANRLPISVKVTETGVDVERSPGGLATGLQGPHEQSDGLWIGWSGAAEELTAERQAELDAKLEQMRLVAVPLPTDLVNRYYQGFSNGVLWPLFHYLLEQVPLQVSDWDAYVEANERFADVVASRYQHGDLIWIHDYQLLLLPGLLRKRIPDARIGFFLHIPFPSEELFRTLPSRERILEGILGADLVGFHTPTYLRHFSTSLIDILGIAVEIDRVPLPTREVRLGVFPMGIDAASFESLAADPAVEAEAKAIRGDGSVRLLVGVDRLDYTKGIPRRLLAYERMLHVHPELRERVRLLQVAVPSRTGVGAYQDYRTRVDQLVGQINGAFGTPRWMPVHYIFRGLAESDLVALYRAADVMLVTPLRDGMNLVAKEFIASRNDGDGVLVLSEFAGASWELPEAVRVNPYDVEGAAEVFYRALTMPADERRARLAPLRVRVRTFDVHRWVASFLEQLEESTPIAPPRGLPAGTQAARDALTSRLAETDGLLLLLDYDGTLVPFAATPDLARPDPGLVTLLGSIAARPDTEVHVVSGRARDALDHWLGHLPVWLHAEHGFWSRAPDSREWVPAAEPGGSWREPVLAILRDITARTPGSLIETKAAAIAWHYRMSDPEIGARRANELRLHLNQVLSNQPVEIIPGHRLLEIRPYGIHKGRIVAQVSSERLANTAILAIGDDRTDEDLFAALPPEAITIRVGPGPTHARFRMDGISAVRALLQSLVDTGVGAGPR
ncbi:MAG TPA: bifunctional alpha,alpha-trehalose-phosphate synthase (UDP-forming)/trehalose-phosphatase [Gemmatimonadales bacterium]|jgi:trehalose 6-phosphate synthase/phosphatase